MELETKKIIDLHKIDVRLSEIEEEKGDLPEIIKEQQRSISDFNNELDSCNEQIEVLNKQKSDYNTNIADFSLKMDKYNQQMDKVKNNKEYDALLIEIDHIKKENDELTQKILNVDEKVSELSQSIEDFSEKIKEMTSKLENNQEELNEKSIEFSVEEKLLLKDKKNLLSKIEDKEFIQDYEDKGQEILASVYNGSCSSCYTNLPAQTLVDVRKGLSLIACPSCSIYLYSDKE